MHERFHTLPGIGGRKRSRTGPIAGTSRKCRLLAVVLAVVLMGGSKGTAAEKPRARQLAARGGSAPAARALAPAATRALPPAALAEAIDQAVEAHLKAEHIPASGPADDAEFLRRVYLDLVGVIPTPEQVLAFLNSPDPNKRARVIDELLANPRFGTFWAEQWTEALVPADSNNRRLKAEPLQNWLAEAFNRQRPWNEIVYDLLTASGTQEENGAVTFFLANPSPDKVTDTVSRLFLGVQLQCAQCHNHPFTSWKRQDYWGMAAFFTQVRLTATPKKAAKQGGSPGITEEGRGRPIKLPDSALRVPPRFLQGEQPSVRPGQPYRPILARWLTAPENPFFARALVNRVWAHFFGRGLVNPVDDMIEEHEPTHPELLLTLTEQFKASGFDLRYLIRAICNSRTYQRSSQVLPGNTNDTELYSHMPVRVLTPGQLFDSLVQVLGQPGEQARFKEKKAANKKGPQTVRQAFLAFFQVADNATPLEYQAGIPQALKLMNTPALTAPALAVRRALQAGGSRPAGVIEQLYLATLSRRPTAEEQQRLVAYVQQQGNPFAAYADILWSLLNSTEFSVNH